MADTKMDTRPHANDIENVATNFFKALGNGITAGDHLAKLMRDVVHSRDTSIFSREYDRVIAVKKDAPAARVMRQVFKAVYPDAKFGKQKNGKSVFKISGCLADESALKRMDQAVKDKLSIRGTFAKAVIGESDEPATVRPADKVARSVIKMAKTNQISREELEKLIDALWNDVTI
jgi:hypothetical protein